MPVNARKCKWGRKMPGRKLDLPASYRRILDNAILLTAEEEQELAKRIQDGDQEARKRMVQSNMRLVVSLALRYRNLGLSDSDLIGEGNCGLIRAVDAFQPGRGARFATYATYHIRLAIRWALTQHAYTVRIPERVVLMMARWKNTEVAIWHATGTQATPQQVASAMGLNGVQTAQILKAIRIRRIASIGIDGEDNPYEGELVDPSNPADSVDTLDEVEFLKQCLEKLDRRDKEILRARYGLDAESEPQTLRKIGQRERVSKEWIRRLGDRAISKLAETICKDDV